MTGASRAQGREVGREGGLRKLCPYGGLWARDQEGPHAHGHGHGHGHANTAAACRCCYTYSLVYSNIKYAWRRCS